MHRAPMIPRKNWGLTEANAFAEASGMAGLNQQKFLCSTCLKDGVVDAPEFIVMVEGNVLCAEHA